MWARPEALSLRTPAWMGPKVACGRRIRIRLTPSDQRIDSRYWSSIGSRGYCFLWEFNAEHNVKTGSEVGLSNSRRQKYQVSHRKRSMQSPENECIDLTSSCPLLREPEHILLYR